VKLHANTAGRYVEGAHPTEEMSRDKTLEASFLLAFTLRTSRGSCVALDQQGTFLAAAIDLHDTGNKLLKINQFPREGTYQSML